MTDNELEEFRYDIAVQIVEDSSKSIQFAWAVDRVLSQISNATQEELVQMAPSEVHKRERVSLKNHLRKKRTKGEGFK